MKNEVVSNFPYIWLTVVGFFMFLGFFVGMVFHVMRKNNKKYFERCADLPLSDGN